MLFFTNKILFFVVIFIPIYLQSLEISKIDTGSISVVNNEFLVDGKTAVEGNFDIDSATKIRGINGAELLFKDTSGDISHIDSTLEIDNLLFSLINQMGISIHKNGLISLRNASIILSTLAVETDDFFNKKYSFVKKSDKFAKIHNKGCIKADKFVVLLSEYIQNEGQISSDLGNVFLGSSKKVVLNCDNEGLINILIDSDVLSETIENHSSFLINNSGLISAKRAIEKGGRIFLKAEDSIVLEKNSLIEACVSENFGEAPSTAHVVIESHDSVVMKDSSFVEVKSSSLGQGGLVEIQGHGRGVWMKDNALISARATHNASGGRVFINSFRDIVNTDQFSFDQNQGQHAFLSDNASIDVGGGSSGWIDFSGQDIRLLNTSKPFSLGEQGTLSFDPRDIVFSTDHSESITVGLDPDADDLLLAFDDNANEDIMIDPSSNGAILSSVNDGDSLIFEAQRDIFIDSDFWLKPQQSAGSYHVTLKAGRDIFVRASLYGSASNINLCAKSNISIVNHPTIADQYGLILSNGIISLKANDTSIPYGLTNDHSFILLESHSQEHGAVHSDGSEISIDTPSLQVSSSDRTWPHIVVGGDATDTQISLGNMEKFGESDSFLIQCVKRNSNSTLTFKDKNTQRNSAFIFDISTQTHPFASYNCIMENYYHGINLTMDCPFGEESRQGGFHSRHITTEHTHTHTIDNFCFFDADIDFSYILESPGSTLSIVIPTPSETITSESSIPQNTTHANIQLKTEESNIYLPSSSEDLMLGGDASLQIEAEGHLSSMGKILINRSIELENGNLSLLSQNICHIGSVCHLRSDSGDITIHAFNADDENDVRAHIHQFSDSTIETQSGKISLESSGFIDCCFLKSGKTSGEGISIISRGSKLIASSDVVAVDSENARVRINTDDGVGTSMRPLIIRSNMLSLDNGSSGGVFLQNEGEFNVENLNNQALNEPIQINAKDSVNIVDGGAGIINNGGNISITSIDNPNVNLSHHSSIKTVGYGNITIATSGSVFLEDMATIIAENGSIRMDMNTDAQHTDQMDLFAMKGQSAIRVEGTDVNATRFIHINTESSRKENGQIILGELLTNSTKVEAVVIGNQNLDFLSIEDGNGDNPNIIAPNGTTLMQTFGGIGTQDNPLELNVKNIDILNSVSGDIVFSQNGDIFVQKIFNASPLGNIDINAQNKITLPNGTSGIRSENGNIHLNAREELVLSEQSILSSTGNIHIEASFLDFTSPKRPSDDTHISLGNNASLFIQTERTAQGQLVINKSGPQPTSTFEWIGIQSTHTDPIFSSKILGLGFFLYKLNLLDSRTDVFVDMEEGDKIYSLGDATTHTVDEVTLTNQHPSLYFNFNDGNKNLIFDDIGSNNTHVNRVVDGGKASIQFENKNSGIILLKSDEDTIVKDSTGTISFISNGDNSFITMNGIMKINGSNVNMVSNGAIRLSDQAEFVSEIGNISITQSASPSGTGADFFQDPQSSIQTRNGIIKIVSYGDMTVGQLSSGINNEAKFGINLISSAGFIRGNSNDFNIQASNSGIALSAERGIGQELFPLKINANYLDVVNHTAEDVFIEEKDTIRLGNLTNKTPNGSLQIMASGGISFINSSIISSPKHLTIESMDKISLLPSGVVTFSSEEMTLHASFLDMQDSQLILKDNLSTFNLITDGIQGGTLILNNMTQTNPSSFHLQYGSPTLNAHMDPFRINIHGKGFSSYGIEILDARRDLFLDIVGGDKIVAKGSQDHHTIDEVILTHHNSDLSYVMKDPSKHLWLEDIERNNLFSSRSIVSSGDVVLQNQTGNIIVQNNGGIDVRGDGLLKCTAGVDNHETNPQITHSGMIHLGEVMETQSGNITLQACEGLFLSSNANIISQTGQIQCHASHGVFEQLDGSIIKTNETIQVMAQGNVTLSGLETALDSQDAIRVQSNEMAVLDGGDINEDINAPNGSVTLDGVSGIGDSNALEINVRDLVAFNTSQGEISLKTKNPIVVNRIENQSLSNNISLISEQGIRIQEDGIKANGGNIVVEVNALPSGDIVNDATIQTTGLGTISLTAEDGVFLSSDKAQILSQDGDITISVANHDQNGDNDHSFSMASGSKIVSQGTTNDTAGTIHIEPQNSHANDFIINSIETNSNKDNAIIIGDEEIENVAIQILEITGENIKAPWGTLVMRSGKGISSLKTEIQSLDVCNSVSGNIIIKEKDELNVTRAQNFANIGNLILHAGGSINIGAQVYMSVRDGELCLLTHSDVNADISIRDASLITQGTSPLILNATDSIFLEGNTSLHGTDGDILLYIDHDDLEGDDGGQLVMSDHARIIIQGGSSQTAGQIRIENNNTNNNHIDSGKIKITGIKSNSNKEEACFIGGNKGSHTSVIDAGNRQKDIAIPQGGLVIDVSSGIGSENALETDLYFLSANNRMTNHISVFEEDSLHILSLKNLSSDGNIQCLSRGTMTISNASNTDDGIIANGGNIFCQAVSHIKADIRNFGMIKTVGTGKIDLESSDSIFLESKASVMSVNGDISILVDSNDHLSDSGNIFVMDKRSNINIEGDTEDIAGIVTIQRKGISQISKNFQINSISTNSNKTDAIILEGEDLKVLGIEDLSSTHTHFSCPNGGLKIHVSSGIGLSYPIETKVASLDIVNSLSGNIAIKERDGVDVHQIVNQAPVGNIQLEASGYVNILSNGNGVECMNGDILLSNHFREDWAQDFLLNIENTIKNQGEGTISLDSYGIISFGNFSNIETRTNGNITMKAPIIRSGLNQKIPLSCLGQNHSVKIISENLEHPLNVKKSESDETSSFSLDAQHSSQGQNFIIDIPEESFSRYDIQIKRSDHQVNLNLPDGDKVLSQGEMTHHIINEVILTHNNSDLTYTFSDSGKGLSIEDVNSNNETQNLAIDGGSGTIHIKNHIGDLSTQINSGNVRTAKDGTIHLETTETGDIAINQGIKSLGHIRLSSGDNILLNQNAFLYSGKAFSSNDWTENSGDIDVVAGKNSLSGKMTAHDSCLIKTTDGKISLNSYGEIALSGVWTNNSMKDAVVITSSNGSLKDAGDLNIDIFAPNGGCQISLASGMTQSNFMEITVASLECRNQVSGDILFEETNDLKIQTLHNNAPQGRIIVRSKGNMSVENSENTPSIFSNGGHIFLEAYNDKNVDIQIYGLIKNIKNGQVALQSSDSLFFKDVGAIEAEDGDVFIIANSDSFSGDSGDSIYMSKESSIQVLGTNPERAGSIFVSNTGQEKKDIPDFIEGFSSSSVLNLKMFSLSRALMYPNIFIRKFALGGTSEPSDLVLSQILTNASGLGVCIDVNNKTRVISSSEDLNANIIAKNGTVEVSSVLDPGDNAPLKVMSSTLEMTDEDLQTSKFIRVRRDNDIALGQISLGLLETTSNQKVAIQIKGGLSTQVVDAQKNGILSNLKAINGGVNIETGKNIGDQKYRLGIDVDHITTLSQQKKVFLNNSVFPIFLWSSDELTIAQDTNIMDQPLAPLLKSMTKSQDFFIEPVVQENSFYRNIGQEISSSSQNSMIRPKEILAFYRSKNLFQCDINKHFFVA